MPRSRAIYVCSYENCTAMFGHYDRYKRHLLKHTGERPFKCTFDGCDKTYVCSSHLKRHEENHVKMFRCTLPGCSMILKTKATLIKHQDVFHRKKEAKKYFKCFECSEEFPKRCMLTRHSYTHSGVHLYKCSEPGCDKSFPMPSLLKRHMKRHVGYVCDESDCSQFFPRWSLLCKHKRECHPKIFRCHVCEKVFNYACNLKKHSLTHKPVEDIFQCDVPKCNRVYKSKHSLSDHVRYFHGSFKIACPEGNCHRFLKSEEALEKHINYRHRRRKNKKMPPKKPDFAEILSGFAKGSKKDLNPHLSTAVLEGKLEESNDETDSSDTTADNEQCVNAQSSEQELNQHLANTILEGKVQKLKEERSEIEVICLDSPDDKQCLVNDEGSKQDLNPHLLHAVVELKDENMEIEAIYLDSSDANDNKLYLNALGSKHKSILPHSNKNFEGKVEKSKDEFIEIEVSCHNLQNSSQSDEELCLGGENYSFSCKAEADQLWNSSDIPINRVK